MLRHCPYGIFDSVRVLEGRKRASLLMTKGRGAMKADLAWEFTGASGVAFAQAWSPAGEVLVVAGLDSGLSAWDMRSGNQVLTVTYPSLLSCVDWSADGRNLVGGSSAGEIVVSRAGGPTIERVWALAQ
jgi:WD40 repeat protein